MAPTECGFRCETWSFRSKREENDAVWEKFLDGEPDSKGVGLFSAGIRIV